MTANRPVAQECYLLAFEAPEIARSAQPGQFVNVDCGTRRIPHRPCDDPDDAREIKEGLRPENRMFLRRPFSISGVDDGRVEIIYRAGGHGTAALSRMAAGRKVPVLGPLGSPIPMPQEGERPVLVAGGIGLPPLIFFARRLAESGFTAELLYGVRETAQVIRTAVAEAEWVCGGVQVAVEEANEGYATGRATELLTKNLRQGDVVYASGPRAMLRAAAGIAERSGNRCWLLMEERMACGIGVCLSCVQDTASGYRLICVEGPAFDSREIIWE